MTEVNKHLFIEYYGSYPKQNFYYNGECRTFWQLKDDRQVIDCLTEPAYNHALKTMDNVRPFVPKSDEDWDEVMGLMDKAEKDKASQVKKDRISFLTGYIKSVNAKVEDILSTVADFQKMADDAIEEAKDVATEADKYAKELATLKPKRKPRKKTEKK